MIEICGGLDHESPVVVNIASMLVSLLVSFKFKWSTQQVHEDSSIP